MSDAFRPFALREELEDSTCVIAVEGELDVATVPRLRDVLANVIATRGGTVVVDLTALTFIDPTGVATLLDALHRLARARGELHIVSPEARTAFELLRLDRTFRLYPSRDAALASVAGNGRTSPP